MTTSSARWAPVLLWVVPAFWSSNYIIARAAEGVIAPHLLASGRWLLAGLILLPFVGRGLARQPEVWRSEWKHLLALGALGMWICGAWVYLGGQTTTSTNIALIYAATPVAIVVVSARLLHERMSGLQKLGAALALAGVLFVVAKGRPADLLAVRLTVGDGWIVACAVSWTAYSVLLKYWPSRLGPGQRLLGIIAGGLIVLLPFTLLEAWLASGPPLGANAIALVVVAAVLPGALSYAAHAYIQRELGASRTALMLYLSPVYAAVLAWLLLGEVPQAYHAVGAALILPSIWLVTRR
ncbi:MAG: EamA/RhaT family transporter [Leptothrix sp. (in: Bacteria)]|nr:EamA/RhaT family transporter [Leptothrix sp. (in: b-proteobacteria)]